MSMFAIILITVISFLHIYLFGRIAGIPLIRHYISLKYIVGFGILFWGIFFLSLTLRHSHWRPWTGLLEFIGMGWMGTLFLLFIFLLAVDLATLFGFLLPRLVPALRAFALVIGLILSGLAFFQGLKPPVVKDYRVALPNLPDRLVGKRVVALSDMHLGTQLGSAWLADRVDQVLGLDPDMVVLVGDILDGHDGTMADLIPELSRLKAPLGVYAVLGNHEFYRGPELCVRILEDAGIKVLRNRWVEIHPGLVLAGVDDLTAGRRFNLQKDGFTNTLDSRPAGTAILLSHTPWQTQQAARSGVNLMISGHTHNGQIWPFNYLVGRVYPLLYGRYEIEGMTAIVCRGTGTWGPRMRLWHPGEILNINLVGMGDMD